MKKTYKKSRKRHTSCKGMCYNSIKTRTAALSSLFSFNALRIGSWR